MNKSKFFVAQVEEAETIIISTHVHPDADGIGSQVALCLALKEFGKKAICVNEEKLLDRYQYLDEQKVIMSFDQYKKKFGEQEIDLFIVVDASNPSRIGSRSQMLLENSKKFLFVDHHPCSPAIAALHIVDTTMSATGQLVGKLIDALKVKITKEMALPLYTAILIDTSSFRYPTVSSGTHKLIARLMETGIEPAHAYNKIYGTKKISHMRLLGEVLQTCQTTRDGTVAWMVVKDSVIKKHNSDIEDTHGFINHLLILENVKVAAMFRDVGSRVKVSFRSSGEIDVSEIAQALGGGGHNHSAATIFEGKLKQVVADTINNVQLILKSMERAKNQSQG